MTDFKTNFKALIVEINAIVKAFLNYLFVIFFYEII